MGRPKDEDSWNQVTREVNGMLKCKHCGHKFKGGASRIKAHVGRKQGQGIRPCSIDPVSVPNNEGVDNIIAASSSNPQGDVNAVNSLQVAGGVDEITDSNFGGLWNHQNDNELRNLLEGFFTVPDMMQNSNRGVQSEISDLKKSMYDLTCEESDIKEQLQLLESWGKKHHIHVDDWLKEEEELKEEAGGVIELTGVTRISGLEIQQLTKQVQMCKEEKPLVLCNELIGKRLEKNIKKVGKLLEDDNIFKIGIQWNGSRKNMSSKSCQG